MQYDSWLVKKVRFSAMRFYEGSYPDEDVTRYMMVHYISRGQLFLEGITPNIKLNCSERLTYEKARLVEVFIGNRMGSFEKTL